jgi:hypothetical protein
MTTLTSTGNVNLTASTNWSPAQIPVAGDVLILNGAHVLTLDADMTLGSVTFAHASARLAVSGATRIVTATNGWIFGAALASVFNAALGAGTTVELYGMWTQSGNHAISSIATSTGGNLKLATVGSDPSAVLFDGTNRTSAGFVVSSSWASGTLTTIGKYSLANWSGAASYIVQMTGGTYNHTNTGVSYLGDRASNKVFSGIVVYILSGSPVVNWSGGLDVHGGNATLATFYVNGSPTITIANGPFRRSGLGPCVQFYSAGSLDLQTPAIVKDRASSFIMAGGTFTFRNQSVSLASDERIVLSIFGGVADLTNLQITNAGRFLYQETGAGYAVIDNDTLITNTTTTAQACVVSASGVLDAKIITYASDAPTLPPVEDVAAGEVYGYSVSPLTGTGLVVDPAVLAAAMGTALGSYETNGVASANDLAALEVDLQPVLDKLPEAGRAATQVSVDAIQTDVDGVLGYLTILVARVTAGAAQLFVDLIAMVTGTGTADAQFTTKALELAGGGLSEAEQEQLDRIEAQTSKLSGTPVTVNGNVRPGGQIVLKHGDDHTVALGNPVSVPVEDTGGTLHTLMAAVGVGNLSVAAIRGNDAASRILGTVAALSYSSNVLTVTIQFTAAESAKGVVGPVYVYDCYKTDTPTRTYFSGRLTLTRDAR